MTKKIRARMKLKLKAKGNTGRRLKSKTMRTR
jgi:hypothetical protein